jgi:hypothetical protein
MEGPSAPGKQNRSDVRPTPAELWQQANGDPTAYHDLLAQHYPPISPEQMTPVQRILAGANVHLCWVDGEPPADLTETGATEIVNIVNALTDTLRERGIADSPQNT